MFNLRISSAYVFYVFYCTVLVIYLQIKVVSILGLVTQWILLLKVHRRNFLTMQFRHYPRLGSR